MPGILITLEGIEGSGKSTHQRFIANYLEQHKKNTLITREPGGCEASEKIRDILLKSKNIAPLTETLLLFAARFEHLEQTIQPGLDKNQWIISDRFNESSFAYQGGGRKMNLKILETLTQWTLKHLKVDLNILFDVDVQTSQKRLVKRLKLDRIEQENQHFFERARNLYLERAKNQKNTHIIDATQSIQVVQNKIVNLLDALIKQHS